MNPFEFWAGMCRSGGLMLDTSVKFAETMQASREVITSRTGTMAEAACNPLGGDYAELGRMVPEKVAAFTEAAAATWNDMQAMQAHAYDNWHKMMGIAMKGRGPTLTEMGAMTASAAAMVERGARAGGKVLAPIHRGATDNARRLNRKSARRK